MFKTGHALLLVETRFSLPTICRPFAGDPADELPLTGRRANRRIAGHFAVVQPPDLSAKWPGNCRAIARQWPGFVPSFAGRLPLLCRRTTAGITGAMAGHWPSICRAYA